MREIKFRGLDIDSGEEVFFNLSDILLDVAGSYSEYIGLHNIEPESVAQFVAYDKHGREVYEGDKVRMIHNGKEYVYTAHMKGFATTADGCYIPAEKFSERELVEAAS